MGMEDLSKNSKWRREKEKEKEIKTELNGMEEEVVVVAIRHFRYKLFVQWLSVIEETFGDTHTGPKDQGEEKKS